MEYAGQTGGGRERITKEELQAEYNRIHEHLGHMTNPVNIAAANRTLDRIVEQMKAVGKK